jgi:hypothetical protein
MPIGYRTTEWFQEIAEGNNDNYTIIHKFGHNDDAGTSWEDVWENGGVYVWLTAAVTLEAISADANDDAGGSGAQTITIEGLDANFDEISETITMNGTDPTTATTKSFLRVNRAYVATTGTYAGTTLGGNAGIITIRTSSGGATHALIDAEGTTAHSQTGIARYTVPNGKIAYMFDVNIVVDSAKTTEMILFERNNADDVTTPFEPNRMKIHLHGVTGHIPLAFDAPHVFPAKTDIWWASKAGGAATPIIVNFMMVLGPA